MSPIRPEQLLATLEWRYAVKYFDPTRKIPKTEWDALERALVLTPSSYGLQPWKFLVIEDESLRVRLRVVSWNQPQVTDCSHFVVFLSLLSVSEEFVDSYISSVAEARGIPVEKLAAFRKNIVNDVVHGPRGRIAAEWSARQAYIALGNFLTAAACVGVDTCPMEGLEAEKYDEMLGLTSGPYRTVVACAAGYRSPQDKLSLAKKVRFPLERVIERR